MRRRSRKAEGPPEPIFGDAKTGCSIPFEQTLARAMTLAREQNSQFAELGHLVLALTSDPEAIEALVACKCDVNKLQQDLKEHIKAFANSHAAKREPTQSAGFQRAITRTVMHGLTDRVEEVTGAYALVAILAEPESRAASLLQDQNISRYALVHYLHGKREQRGE
jgi:ATP-dependent Clp protease ATP-binding subunit ClpA